MKTCDHEVMNLEWWQLWSHLFLHSRFCCVYTVLHIKMQSFSFFKKFWVLSRWTLIPYQLEEFLWYNLIPSQILEAKLEKLRQIHLFIAGTTSTFFLFFQILRWRNRCFCIKMLDFRSPMNQYEPHKVYFWWSPLVFFKQREYFCFQYKVHRFSPNLNLSQSSLKLWVCNVVRAFCG